MLKELLVGKGQQDLAPWLGPAGGCFWGLELAYQREPGVTATSVGYTQGSVEGPSYQAVCSGRTGHTEAVQVRSGAEAGRKRRGRPADAYPGSAPCKTVQDQQDYLAYAALVVSAPMLCAN